MRGKTESKDTKSSERQLNRVRKNTKKHFINYRNGRPAHFVKTKQKMNFFFLQNEETISEWNEWQRQHLKRRLICQKISQPKAKK